MLIGAEGGDVSDCCSGFEPDSPLKAGSDDSMSGSPEVLLLWFPRGISRLSSRSDTISTELLNADG